MSSSVITGSGNGNGKPTKVTVKNEDELSPDSRMARLERRATVVKSRLLRAIDALDTRRHQVVEIGETAKALVKPAALSVIGVAALVGLGVAAFSLGFKMRGRRTLGYKAKKAVAKLARDLEIVQPRPSLTRRMLERVALTAVSLATAEVGRRFLKNGVDGRLLDGRLAVGGALDAHHEELQQHHKDIAVRTLTSASTASSQHTT